MDVGTIHGSSGWWSHNKWGDVQSASVLLTWAHNSMLISYESIWSCCRPRTPERKVKLRWAVTKNITEIFQTVLLCSPSVWWCSHHRNRSRTCARHWERCRSCSLTPSTRVGRPQIPFPSHVLLQSPQVPQSVPEPSKVFPRSHLNLEDWEATS